MLVLMQKQSFSCSSSAEPCQCQRLYHPQQLLHHTDAFPFVAVAIRRLTLRKGVQHAVQASCCTTSEAVHPAAVDAAAAVFEHSGHPTTHTPMSLTGPSSS
jgi:hypothetical protein